jgi:proteasome alpha subunit
VMGGQADAIMTELRGRFTLGQSLEECLGMAVGALGSAGGTDGKPRELPTSQLEVAVLDRTRGKRKFRRISGAALTALLPARDQTRDAENAADNAAESADDSADKRPDESGDAPG